MSEPAYIFDDRFIEVMPRTKWAVADVFDAMAKGMRKQKDREQMPTSAKLVGAALTLAQLPLTIALSEWRRMTNG